MRRPGGRRARRGHGDRARPVHPPVEPRIAPPPLPPHLRGGAARPRRRAALSPLRVRPAVAAPRSVQHGDDDADSRRDERGPVMLTLACSAVARGGMVATTASLDDTDAEALVFVAGWLTTATDLTQIGRASCRERV